MKKFTIYIAIRVLIIIVLLFILDVVYTNIYINKKGIRNKIEFIFQNKNKQYDIIFLGSSRVEFHVNTPLINKETGKESLNLGTSGQTLTESFLALKLLIEQNIKAKKYFIQVDESDLIENNKKSFIGASYFMPFTRNSEVEKHLKKYDVDYYKDSKFPFYRYMNYGYKIGYRELLLKIGNKNRKKGFYIGLESIMKKDTTSVQFKNKYSSELINEIQEFGKSKKINLILYTSPYFNVKNQEFFKETLKKNDIAYYIDSIKKVKYFKDAGHLNKYGATKFTEMLIRDFDLKN